MSTPKPIGTSTSMMIVLFGTNALLWLFFQWIVRQERKTDTDDAPGSPDKKAVKKKALSKPFTLTVDGFTCLTNDLLKMGFIMAVTYICENHWIFEHSQKEYNRDLFMFVCAIFFVYGFATLEPTKDLTLLSRDQTEEWKGWMQFIFLLYHYFHAEEVYNSIRIMITCYVWMTGFGNFSFFYIKQDFGWLRVVQMMWRLNFAVLFLMWTHGNTYILYYICPLHTFYFLMVYATMVCYSQVNHSKWGIRCKLMIVGVIIFIVWDLNSNIFDLIFGTVLGTDKIIGAKQGSLWEYYFRTSLDHYSSFLGMIFALNFPLAEQYYHKANGTWARAITGAVLAVLSVYWYNAIYTMDKFDYNLSHSYWAIVPLTTYIFFRNITPGIRSKVSMSMHALGKTTLETYLLQHHVWLTSNAKTLLTVIPDSPYMNFLVVSIIFYLLSKELYGLTMSLRGMILPEDGAIAWVNLLGMAAVLVSCAFCAFLLHIMHMATLFSAFLCSFLLFVGVLHAIKKYCPKISEVESFSTWFPKTMQAAYVGMGAFVVLHIVAVLMSSSPGQSSANAHRMLSEAAEGAPSPMYSTCFSNLAQGQWSSTPCDVTTAADVDRRSLLSAGDGGSGGMGYGLSTTFDAAGISFSRYLSDAQEAANHEIVSKAVGSRANAYCQTNNWHWAPAVASECDYRGYSNTELGAMFRGKRVVFIGDSMLRSSYHAFNQLIDPEYNQMEAVAKSYAEATAANKERKSAVPAEFKHIDLKHFHKTSETSVEFLWAPQLTNMSRALKKSTGYGAEAEDTTAAGVLPPDVVILGAAAWDALYTKDVGVFKEKLEQLTFPAHQPPSPLFTAWILPTAIIDTRLNSDSKKTHMSEAKVAQYRSAVKNSRNVRANVDVVIDPSQSVSVQKHSSGAIDGVHYGDDVYAVIGQLCVNGYSLSRRTTAVDGEAKLERVVGHTAKGKNAVKDAMEAKAAKQAPAATNDAEFTPVAPVAKIDAPKAYKPKPTGSMSFPLSGLAVLILAATMLFTMDSYLGFGFVGLLVVGRALDYEEAYTPLLKSINRNIAGEKGGEAKAEAADAGTSSAAASSSSSSAAGEGDQEMDSLITRAEEGSGSSPSAADATAPTSGAVAGAGTGSKGARGASRVSD